MLIDYRNFNLKEKLKGFEVSINLKYNRRIQ